MQQMSDSERPEGTCTAGPDETKQDKNAMPAESSFQCWSEPIHVPALDASEKLLDEHFRKIVIS